MQKETSFPTFELNNLRDTIYVPNGYVDWALLHSVYEKDQNLEAHLKKAHTLTYRATHPGDNKQSVPLALAILLLTSVIKEDINFWEHDLYENKDLTGNWQHKSQMHECVFHSADSLEVSATVSGYIA